ncbi:MAG: four helix bundle protein [Candidatus Bipolaricaulia bacterium]
MKIKNFEDIDAWKQARNLTNKIYDLTSDGDFSRDYGLRDQIQRSSVSIMANIAEGFDSSSNQSFLNFLGYALRSASEVQSHLYVALDQDYISQEDFDILYDELEEVKNLISGFRRYLKKSDRQS